MHFCRRVVGLSMISNLNLRQPLQNKNCELPYNMSVLILSGYIYWSEYKPTRQSLQTIMTKS